MSVESNISLARRWFDEIWNRGNFQVIHELSAPSTRSHGHQDQPMVGPDQFLEFAQRLRGAFPDMQLTIDDIFGVDDRVVVRWSAVMTHLGDTLGLPATGRRVRTNGISIIHFHNNKATAAWDSWDRAGLMDQITTTNG